MLNPFEQNGLNYFIKQSDVNVNLVLPALGTLARQDVDEDEAFEYVLDHYHLNKSDFTDFDWEDMHRLYRKERG